MSSEKTPASSMASTATPSPAASARRRGCRAGASPPPRAAASLEAKRRAAVILEVLAGLRRPSEAAAALGVSVPRYYLLEEQALRGLLTACEPRQGTGPRLETRLAQLEKQLAQAQRECARQHALVRVAQRSVGLMASPTAKSTSEKTAGNTAKSGKSRRRRRPAVRALKAVRALGVDSSGTSEGEALQPGASAPARGAAELPVGQGKEA